MQILDWASEKIQRLTDTFRKAPSEPQSVGQPDPAAAEFGWGGTSVFGGQVLDDYNPDLRGKALQQTLQKMRRTSGQVRAVQTVLSLPVRATTWYVAPADGANAAERKAAQLLQANLMGGLKRSFDDLLCEACLATFTGFRTPEIVWGEDGGRVTIEDVAPRNPELIERWLYYPDGGLAGYLYTGNRPVGTGLEGYNATLTRYERLPIPIEKTLHFVYDQENDNPEGFGLGRSMYPHWYIVQALYLILNIGAERNLLGTPYAQRKPGGGTTTEAAKKAVLSILQRLRATDGGAFVITDDWDIKTLETGGAMFDAMPYIAHHDVKIAQVALAQFLNLGQHTSASQALATVHAKLFESGCEAVARWIEQAINAQLVRRWTLLNYGPNFRAPVLKHKPIRSQDLQAWAIALSTLVTGGLLHSTPDDEARVRDLMELPEIPKEQLDKAFAEAKKVAAAAAKPGAGSEPAPADEGADDPADGADKESE